MCLDGTDYLNTMVSSTTSAVFEPSSILDASLTTSTSSLSSKSSRQEQSKFKDLFKIYFVGLTQS